MSGSEEIRRNDGVMYWILNDSPQDKMLRAPVTFDLRDWHPGVGFLQNNNVSASTDVESKMTNDHQSTKNRLLGGTNYER